jgi:AraC-like DNA-binding protein
MQREGRSRKELLTLSNEPNGIGVSPSHLRTEINPVSETLCCLVFLEYRTLDKVQKLINSECYTESLEHFRINFQRIN